MLFFREENTYLPIIKNTQTENRAAYRIFDIDELLVQPFNPNYSFNQELQKTLSGRQLLFDELPFSIEEIHEHYINGYIKYGKGIAFDGNKIYCNRCGNYDDRLFASFHCARCHQACLYCRKCIMMGRVSQCSPLLEWVGPTPTFNFNKPLSWSGKLSPSQKEASQKIIEAVEVGNELLIWAVCGAGKTEMLFEGISRALEIGKRVAIATPRTDVVLELAPRLKQVFPKVEIAALYGGSPDRYLFAPLTITTTHQLLRFNEAFDVMIIDEVDAFPFSADLMLQQAAEKAKKNGASQIFLTATPNPKWQRECYSGKRNCVILPARFHRHPLPIPRFIWTGNWRKAFEKGRIPSPILYWLIDRLELEKQALIFFPHIELMERMLPVFQKYNSKIESVHAEDPERKMKVKAMRDGEIPILLTTTILERGVTIPNIDVAVIGAEDDTFTESALVQIAGRVGRSSNNPRGDIAFFHFGKSQAMMRARNQLKRMNQDAKNRGLIDD